MSWDLNTLSALVALSADGFVSAFNRTDDKELKTVLFERLLDRRKTLARLQEAQDQEHILLVAATPVEQDLTLIWDQVAELADRDKAIAIERIVAAEEFLSLQFERSLSDTALSDTARAAASIALEEIGTGEFVRDHVEDICYSGALEMTIEVQTAA